ncbi:MAG: hypothetical protein SV062_09650 [Thermodesulfobacteriota bacterium]|nr:hypothetical protein [Thermodesulfobacteriota bacterium]
MDGAIMGMVAFLIPVVVGISVLVSKMYKIIQEMDKRLKNMETILEENKK